MHWVQRGNRSILYRSTKRNGRVIKEYLGRGELADMAHKVHLLTADERDRQEVQLNRERERIEHAQRLTEDFGRLVHVLFRAAMIIGGYYRHGKKWKKRQRLRRRKRA